LTPGVAQSFGGEAVRRPGNGADRLGGGARMEKKKWGEGGQGRWPTAFFMTARWRGEKKKKGRGSVVRSCVEGETGKREGARA
jgi:hypothetical protein